MSVIAVGQVLSLKIRYNNSGLCSGTKHPYLVIAIDEDFGYVEIAQLDSLEGKQHKASMRCNKTIFADNPKETPRAKLVFDKQNNVIYKRNIENIDCGSFCQFGGYGAEAGYRPQSDKMYMLTIFGEEKRMETSGFYLS